MSRLGKLLLLCFLLLIVQTSLAVPRDEILKVYNWADYIDDDMVADFEKWYHEHTGKYIHVVYQTFDINESMLTEIEIGRAHV